NLFSVSLMPTGLIIMSCLRQDIVRARSTGAGSRTAVLLDMREDAVELVETVVVDDELAAALGAVLQMHLGAELVGEVLLEPRDVRVGTRRLTVAGVGLRGREL